MDEKSRSRSDIPKIDSSAKSDAQRNLRSAEAGASSDAPKQPKDDLGGARANENAANGLYTGSGRDLSGLSAKGRLSGKSRLKGKGPIGFIIALIVGVGGLSLTSQFFQPFALVEQFRELFNSMHVSTSLRSDAWFKMQMGSGKYVNPIKGHVFRADTFKISERQRARLAKQNIEVEEYDGHTVLKFDDGTGTPKIITADARTASEIGGGAVDFKTMYRDNPDFFNGYNQGSMTWRGAISNWFNSVTAKFLSKNKITRNMFKDFIEKAKASADGNTRTYALETMAKGTEEIEEPGAKVLGKQDEYEERPIYGDPQNPDKITGYETVKVDETGIEGRSNVSKARYTRADLKANPALVDNVISDIEEKFKGGDKASSIASGIVNVGCTLLNFAGAISLLVSAAEAAQIIKLISGYTEAVDKAKAGFADDSPIMDLAADLNEPRENKHVTLFGKSIVIGADGGYSNGIHSEESSTTKSAMESEGIASLFQGTKINAEDPSVKSFNVSSNILSFSASVDAFLGCMFAKMVTNIISVGIQVAKIALCIVDLLLATVTFGASIISCLAKLIGPDILKKIAFGTALSVGLGIIASNLSPLVTNLLTRDLIGDIGGEDLGNALTSGANMVLGNNHRFSGGSLATEDKYIEFAVAQQSVIAEDAKIERAKRSPFDATSKYTFMGTLLTQLMSFTSARSLLGTISASSNVLVSSIAAISPTARAGRIVENLPDPDEYEKTCPFLASIGAIGDPYCNPYSITDITTIESDPAEIINQLGEESFADELQSDGNVKVAGDSDLAKYLLYCNSRESAFGFADQNISDEIVSWGKVRTKNSKLNTILNAGLSSTTLIGDTIDIFQSEEAIDGAGWIGGESCVAGNDNVYKKSPNWETGKLFQRFFEDQSLAETEGLVKKSAASAFLEEYYAEHPLDESYEGVLARRSGLSKDTVIAVLNYVEYGNYLAEYDPSTRFQFTKPVIEEEDQPMFFENENEVAENPVVILLNQISFADVRNRNFVV